MLHPLVPTWVPRPHADRFPLPFPLDPTEHVQFWVDSPATMEGWVREGDSVQLVCRGDGNSSPEYIFYRLQVTRSLVPLESPAPDFCDLLTCTKF